MQGIEVRINEDFSQQSMIGSGDNDVDPKGFLNVDEQLIPSCRVGLLLYHSCRVGLLLLS